MLPRVAKEFDPESLRQSLWVYVFHKLRHCRHKIWVSRIGHSSLYRHILFSQPHPKEVAI